MNVTDTNAHGFQQLVNANLDVIRCRAAAVNSTNATLGSKENNFLWSVRGGTLAFEGSDFTAFIGDRKEDVDNRANGPQIGIDVEVLSRKSVGMKVAEVTLRDGGSAVQFMSDEGVGQDGRLATLAADLSASSRAEKAVVLIHGGQLSLNFKEATATAKTRSTPLMAHLLVAAMPLLHEFADERHEALEAFLHVEGATESSGNSGTVEDLLTLLLERTSEDSE